jgi:23S rRNA pseudouridine1911/1915/1917 synthase
VTFPPELQDHERRSVRVPAESAGQRLDLFVAGWLGASRSRVRRLLARGAVKLDGQVQGVGDKGSPLAVGQRVEVEGTPRREEEVVLPETGPEGLTGTGPEGLTPTILARGEGWCVVDKPAGRAVHPLEPDETGTVLNAVVRFAPEVQGVGEGGLRSGVVHRLDVETSGALVVATREETWQRLRSAFRERRVAKRYRALVAGVPDPKLLGRHEVSIWVARHRPARVRVAPARERSSHPGARLAALDIESIAPLEGAAEVVVRLETGFLHQIRATLAFLGHPVLGDEAYGGARPDIPRPMLHAARLGWDDVDVEAPLPDDYVAARRALGAS